MPSDINMMPIPSGMTHDPPYICKCGAEFTQFCLKCTPIFDVIGFDVDTSKAETISSTSNMWSGYWGSYTYTSNANAGEIARSR